MGTHFHENTKYGKPNHNPVYRVPRGPIKISLFQFFTDRVIELEAKLCNDLSSRDLKNITNWIIFNKNLLRTLDK